MKYTALTISRTWEAAEGKCQCTNTKHGHGIPHGELLNWGNRGRPGLGAWEIYSVSGRQLDAPSYCRIYCLPCFKTP